ncbi:MFS general substrate transporter [Mytilinidion resinicola]|uniref:MFS general substrate transporter n=1 Tax=Mytilinidion resinicola TaxID=574789 RepID=A0A6A6XYX0_9PEZI|nr:MFS general substrate transporter [Mytilinidion resinicola]KAF2801610.1 MFS general substrate transporter [Mytilinidion resinicola]
MLPSSPAPLPRTLQASPPSTDDGDTRLTPSSDSEGEDEEATLGQDHAGQSYRMKNMSSRSFGKGDSGETPSQEHVIDGEDEDRSLLRESRRLSQGSSVESYELYTPDEDKAVLRSLDRKLVLFMALLYLLSFLDRSNIGNARIAGLERDLTLSSSQYEWLLTAFYITYIVFEWMTLLYRIVPPHIYISLCVLSWGIIASLQSTSTSFGDLLFLRALLGVSEAAFGPGVPFYLSFFFRRDELALRTGLFISAAPLATSFASSLAWFITKLGEHGPLAPWRLLFLVEGFPSVVVAAWAWELIPDSPGTASFLTPRLRDVAILRLREEKEASDGIDIDVGHEKREYPREKKGRLIFTEVLQTLRDPKCYLTALMFFSCNVAFSSLPVFLPTIIRDMGHTSLKAQALSAPPYLFSFVVVLLTAYLSDRYQTRSAFIMLHALLGASGYLLIALAGFFRWDHFWRYLGIYPAAAGFFSAITIIITWTINNQESDSKKGTGMAMLNIIGQCGPLVGTRLYPDTDAPFYVRGMSICSIFMIAVGGLAFLLRIVLARANKGAADPRRRERSETDAGIPLVGDSPAKFEKGRFVFML